MSTKSGCMVMLVGQKIRQENRESKTPWYIGVAFTTPRSSVFGEAIILQEWKVLQRNTKVMAIYIFTKKCKQKLSFCFVGGSVISDAEE